MSLSNIVNEFHNEHSLANTCATKEPNLSTSLVRCKEINNLENVATKM